MISAKEKVFVFQLCRPMAVEHVFHAAADHWSSARFISLETFRMGRLFCRIQVVDAEPGIVQMCKRHAAFGEKQETMISDARAQADAADPVGPGLEGARSGVRAGQPFSPVGRVIHLRVREIAFGANNEPPANLVIVALFSTDKETTMMLVNDQVLWGPLLPCCPPQVAPAVATLHPEVKAGPVTWFRHYRRGGDLFGLQPLRASERRLRKQSCCEDTDG